MSNKSKHEISFLRHWKLLYPDLPEPVREHRFHPTRKWRFDFGFPDLKIAVELHGGGNRGRHNTVAGMAKDLEKYNTATVAGWRCLAFNVVLLADMPAVCDWVAELVRQEME